MNQQITKNPQTMNLNKPDELILVVPRHELMQEKSWHGIKQVDFTHYLSIIEDKKQFLWRSEMELNPSFKQIIPYLIFNYQDRYFLMQRQASASETRLRNKFSLGIGGHIRKEDMTSKSIFDWAKREFHEEVFYEGSLEIEPLGILNDDTDDVGKVHLGFVFLLKGDNGAIKVKSELKSGILASLDECLKHLDRLESWSQITISFIASKNN